MLTGGGRFAADLRFPDMLEAAFVRSPHAHARIRGIDTGKARAHPNVQAVFTLADFAPLLSSERLPLGFRTDELPPDITPFVLARDEVAFAGEAVAVVVAVAVGVVVAVAVGVGVGVASVSSKAPTSQAVPGLSSESGRAKPRWSIGGQLAIGTASMAGLFG